MRGLGFPNTCVYRNVYASNIHDGEIRTLDGSSAVGIQQEKMLLILSLSTSGTVPDGRVSQGGKRADMHGRSNEKATVRLSSRVPPLSRFRRRRHHRRHHHSRSAARFCYLAPTCLVPPPRRPLPRMPCQPTSWSRFRFVRAGAAVHQSLLVPAPAFDGRVAAARSVIARL